MLTKEDIARDLAERSTLVLATAEDLITDFERQKETDEEIKAESLAAFERGEITEDEIDDGDMLLSINLVRIFMESPPIEGRKFGAYQAVPLQMLRDHPECVSHYAERLRCIVYKTALDYLSAKAA